MRTAKAEGQAIKGCERKLRGADVGGRQGGQAGKSEQRPGNITGVLPLLWLFGQGMDIFSPK